MKERVEKFLNTTKISVATFCKMADIGYTTLYNRILNGEKVNNKTTEKVNKFMKDYIDKVKALELELE